MKIIAIVAVDNKGGMGVDNRLLCHLPDDLKFFKQTTLGKTVVMGRRTYESIGKPLPNRRNIILTRQSEYKADGCFICHSIPECIEHLEYTEGDKEIFIIGGASIFEQTVTYWEKLIITIIDNVFDEADAFFPEFQSFLKDDRSNGWKRRQLIRRHDVDEKHLYSFSTYEIDKDKRYTRRHTQASQFRLEYIL